jgi:hypothetical protein
MLNRTCASLLLLGVTVLGAAAPAAAQQTLNFSVGYFTPLGQDARVEGDVLNSNRNFLVFDVDDFASASVGGEWLVGIGNFVEAGAGLSFTRRTVPSVYEDFIDNDGTEVDQDLRLRIIPVSFTVRVIPTGQGSAVQPYFGAGLGVFNWRYSESGEFIDFSQGREIFRDQFVADGNQAGLVALAGLRFVGDAVSGGGEIRYQKADAELDDRFAGSRIDLGGWTYQFNLGIRFR